MSASLRPNGQKHARLPCPSPTPGACSNSCPLSQWCHPTISSSVVLFSCLQSFPASGIFPMSQFFESGSQSIGASALVAVLPMNIQDWFPLGSTGLISLQEYVKAVCCHPVYLIYILIISWEMSGWMNYKLESRFLREISITLDIQMTPPLQQKAKRNWRAAWWRWRSRVKKSA